VRIPRYAFIALMVIYGSTASSAQELSMGSSSTYGHPAHFGAGHSGGNFYAINPELVSGPYPQPDPFPIPVPYDYPQTDYGSVIDTNGWPVTTQFKHYPQGIVSDEGYGIYQCLLPAYPPEECFCTPPPCYFGTLYVSGVVLDRRTNLRPATLIYDATLTTELANTSEFNMEIEAGFRLGFWLTHPSGLDWNVDYFNVGNFEDTVSREDAATVNAFFFGGSFTTPPTSLTAEYGSTLDSLEFGLRARQWPRIAPLVAIRFLQVEEEFNYLSDVTNRTGFFSTTDNELYGIQFGFQGLIYQWCYTRLETTLKAGAYYNDIDVDATVNVGGVDTTFSSSTDWAAFSGEARVTLVCQLGPKMNFRIGYHALWLDGIALAPNQNTERSFTPPTQVTDISDVLYNGGEIGFELTW
jgi:hypothetical protein